MARHYLPASHDGWIPGLCYLSITRCWRRISLDDHSVTEVVAPGPGYSEFTGVGKHRSVDDEVHA